MARIPRKATTTTKSTTATRENKNKKNQPAPKKKTGKGKGSNATKKESKFVYIDDDAEDDDENFADNGADSDEDYIIGHSSMKGQGTVDDNTVDDSTMDEDEDDDDQDEDEDDDMEDKPSTSKATHGESREGSKSLRRSRQKADVSALLELLDVDGMRPSTSKTVNFATSGGSAFLAYQPEYWTPQYLYRLPADVVLSTIKEFGSEGIGRAEIGQRLSMDTSTKAGNRRVSAFIQNICERHKEKVGQYQKMDGKIRTIKYFWKSDSQPEKFIRLFEEFENLARRPCPFKLGQVIKFEKMNLNTLRISDVSLRRLIDILNIVTKQRVVVTIHRIMKMMNDIELASGYPFQMDKKSLLKCMKALEKENLLRIYDTVVVVDSIINKVQIICHPDIDDVKATEVEDAIQATLDEYDKEGRCFPHGQLKYSSKKKAEMLSSTADEELLVIPTSFENGIPLLARYQLLRVQNSRATIVRDPELPSAERNDQYVSKTSEQGLLDLNETSASTTLNDTNRSFEEEVSMMTSTTAETSFNETFTSNGVKMKRGAVPSELEFGAQGKTIKWMIMHEIIFQFVYGHPVGTKPDAFDRFPPNEAVMNWSQPTVDQLPVYVDEEGPFRFMPPFTPFQDIPRGWFMVQDLMYSLPLSVLVLCAQLSKNVPVSVVRDYLQDPIKRHVCIGDLPTELRSAILRDKRVVRQIEHLIQGLCALGLAALAPNPDPKRYANANSTLFFVAKSGILYDTSTSVRGYATVSLPLTQYDKYVYEFKCQDDVIFFWHHLRAIVQSTPLSFRNDVNAEEIALNRHKKYSIGVFDKHLRTYPVEEELESVPPIEPHDGVGGFDSALYVHLKRHWDVIPRPNWSVSWFISRFRRQSDSVRKIVEKRVSNLQKDWNSYVKSLMPSDLELQKKKKIKAGSFTATYPGTRTTISIEPKPKQKLQMAARVERKKKRPLDSVDMVSEQSRVHMRSRFSSKERDMLILIRAVGFFLNPVYRFWLDPAVLRDIMHEYVPESRSKTIQSLMAAGVREMVRSNRLAYLQRIVRNLATFQEMCDLRFQLASAPLSTAESKTKFFKNAFDVANNLLFMEFQSLPHYNDSNAQFDAFLSEGKIVVSTQQSSANPLPLRSQKPSTLQHIEHCIAINTLLSILLHSTDGSFAETILHQLSASVIHNALEVLRSDGLVSRSRQFDPQLHVITKNHAVLSYYFRHFFAHRFHPDLLEQSRLTFDQLEESPEGAIELIGEHTGLIIAASSAFYHSCDLELSVDDDMLNVFDQSAEETIGTSTKQIRFLENTDLKLEKIHVYLGLPDEAAEPLPSIRTLIQYIDRSHPESSFPAIPFEDFLLNFPVESRKDMRCVYGIIKKSDVYGASIEDIGRESRMTRASILIIIGELLDAHQIFEVGVDTRRWVTQSNSEAWIVTVEDRRTCFRPWTLSTGGICESTIRWMAESTLMTVVANPGIPVKDLRFRYEFALQPAALDDLVVVLEAAQCITVHEEVFENMELSSPFQEYSEPTVYTYLLPAPDCVERFAKIFGGIPLLSAMTGSKVDEDVLPPPSKNIQEDIHDDQTHVNVIKVEAL